VSERRLCPFVPGGAARLYSLTSLPLGQAVLSFATERGQNYLKHWQPIGRAEGRVVT